MIAEQPDFDQPRDGVERVRRFSEGLLLRRLHPISCNVKLDDRIWRAGFEGRHGLIPIRLKGASVLPQIFGLRKKIRNDVPATLGANALGVTFKRRPVRFAIGAQPAGRADKMMLQIRLGSPMVNFGILRESCFAFLPPQTAEFWQGHVAGWQCLACADPLRPSRRCAGVLRRAIVVDQEPLNVTTLVCTLLKECQFCCV
jgi:hypothetical protein